jgi:hypothetical protein
VGVHVEISDETFIAIAPARVAAEVARPEHWARWWPDLDLQVTRDRGPKGVQWRLIGEPAGTAEVYLEPWHDGTIVHLYLRLELPEAGVARQLRSRTRRWKRSVHGLKDELEAGRSPGTPA